LDGLTTLLSAFARWITILLNPAVAAVLAFLFLQGYPEPDHVRWSIWAILLGPGAPALYAVVVRLSGRAASVFLPDTRKRVLPLGLAVCSCCVGVWVLAAQSAPDYAVLLMAAYALVAFVTMIVSGWWGISLHTAGVTLPWCLGVMTVGTAYIYVLPVVVAVGWARIKLREHSTAQVAAGGLLGMVAALVVSAFMGS
jgi:hypothetical protein